MDECVSLLVRVVSSAHGRKHAAEFRAVKPLFHPRFSCTVLLNVLLLSRGERLGAKIRWREREGARKLKEKLSFLKIFASSGASQAEQWIKTSWPWHFSLNQTCTSSNLYL